MADGEISEGGIESQVDAVRLREWAKRLGDFGGTSQVCRDPVLARDRKQVPFI